MTLEVHIFTEREIIKDVEPSINSVVNSSQEAKTKREVEERERKKRERELKEKEERGEVSLSRRLLLARVFSICLQGGRVEITGVISVKHKLHVDQDLNWCVFQY